MTIENIISDLEHEKRHYDLDGVEITEEDALHVMDLVHDGVDKDEAVEITLNEIRDGLEEYLEKI